MSSPNAGLAEFGPVFAQDAIVTAYLHNEIVPNLTASWDVWYKTNQPDPKVLADKTLFQTQLTEQYQMLAIAADTDLMRTPGYALNYGTWSQNHRVFALVGPVQQSCWDARCDVLFDAAISQVGSAKSFFDLAASVDVHTKAIASLNPSVTQKNRLAMRGVQELASSLGHHRDVGTMREQREVGFERILNVVSDDIDDTTAATIKTAYIVRDTVKKMDQGIRVTDGDIARLAKARACITKDTSLTPDQRKVLSRLIIPLQTRRADAMATNPSKANQAKELLTSLGAVKAEPTTQVTTEPRRYEPVSVNNPVHINLSPSTEVKVIRPGRARLKRLSALSVLAGSGGALLNNAAAIAEPLPMHVGVHRAGQANQISMSDLRKQILKEASTYKTLHEQTAGDGANLVSQEAQSAQSINTSGAIDLVPVNPVVPEAAVAPINEANSVAANSNANSEFSSTSQNTYVTATATIAAPQPDAAQQNVQLTPVLSAQVTGAESVNQTAGNGISVPSENNDSPTFVTYTAETPPTTVTPNVQPVVSTATITVPQAPNSENDPTTTDPASSFAATAAPPNQATISIPQTAGVTSTVTSPGAGPEALAEVPNTFTQQSVAGSDYETKLSDNTASLQDTLNAYNGVMQAAGETYAQSNTPQYNQIVMDRANGLWTAISGPNSGLTHDQEVAAKRHIVQGCLVMLYPDLANDANFAPSLKPSVTQPEYGIYVQAVAPNYISPTDSATALGEGVQQSTMLAVVNQFTYADAGMYDAAGRLAQLQSFDIDAYNSSIKATKTYNLAQSALAAVAITKGLAGSNNPSNNPAPAPGGSKSPAAPNQAPSPENLSTHQQNINAAKAMIHLGGDWTNQGIVALYMLEHTDYTLAQISGIIGNGMQESGLVFERKQTIGGSAKGAFQWEGGRFDALVAYAQQHNGHWSDSKMQLGYLLTEFPHEVAHGHLSELQNVISWANENTSTSDALKGVSTPKDAAKVVEYTYERAGTPMMHNRIRGAERFFDKIKKLGGNDIPAPSNPVNPNKQAPESPRNRTINKHTPYSEYILQVPKGGSGHAVPYVNQVSDLDGVHGINGYDACGLTSTYTIEQALKQNPQSIAKLHNGLMNANAYSDSAGIENTNNLMSYIEGNLGLNVDTIRWEKNGDTTDANLADARAALDAGKILLVHTSSKVSALAGGTTKGHYFVMYGYDDTGYYVANVGNRADSPPQGHSFSRKVIESWIDGIYAISN